MRSHLVKRGKPAGFSLSEMLVTIAVIGVMSGIMLKVRAPDLPGNGHDTIL